MNNIRCTITQYDYTHKEDFITVIAPAVGYIHRVDFSFYLEDEQDPLYLSPSQENHTDVSISYGPFIYLFKGTLAELSRLYNTGQKDSYMHAGYGDRCLSLQSNVSRFRIEFTGLPRYIEIIKSLWTVEEAGAYDDVDG